MTIKSLIEFFETFENVPVEIGDVRDQIVETLGIDDEIILHKSDDMDPKLVIAMLVRFTKRTGVYKPPQRCALIIYSGLVPIEVQRVACCKELVHLLDEPSLRSNSRDEVITLINNLTQGLDLGHLAPGDWQAVKDKLAMFQALAILFPHQAREELMPLWERNEIDETLIADRFCIPQEHVELMMSDRWDSFRKSLMEM